jgi:chemotaxis protein MotB
LAARFGGEPTRRWQIACAVCAALLVAVSLGYAWPLRREVSQLRDAERVMDEREREARATLEETRESLGRTQSRLTRLEEDTRDREATSTDVRRRLEKLERVLSTQFGRLARADMLLVSSAGDRLSVALAVPVLFPLGRTTVTANGRALLCELAQTILQHHDGQLRVSGYYGKPAIAEPALARYGSPWHLSAARAASAAAVLERDCEVAAERVYAVGYGPRAPGPLGENVALELVLSQRD